MSGKPAPLILWSTSTRSKKRKMWLKTAMKLDEHLPPINSKSPYSRSTVIFNKKASNASQMNVKVVSKKHAFLINCPFIKEVRLTASKWSPSEHPLKSVDRAKIEDILSKTPPREKISIQGLADFFKMFSLNEAEKAFLIFRWHALNIVYNQEGLVSGNLGDNSPGGVLISGKAVCAGYAALFNAISEQLALKTHIISGNGRTIATDPELPATSNHAWIAVEIKGKWYLIDPTWGAGASAGNRWEKKYNEYHFCPNPAEFIRTHFPDEVKWQLLDKTITKDTYKGLGLLKDSFFSYGLTKTTPDSSVIKTPDSTNIIIEFPPILKRHFTAKLDEKNEGKLVEIPLALEIKVESDKVSIKTPNLKSGIYRLYLFCGLKENSVLDCVATYKIKCGQKDTPGKSSAKFQLPQHQKGAELIAPKGKVKKDDKVEFKVKIPGAKKVAVFLGKTLYQLIPKGENIFEGKVLITDTKEASVRVKSNIGNEYKEIFKVDVK